MALYVATIAAVVHLQKFEIRYEIEQNLNKPMRRTDTVLIRIETIFFYELNLCTYVVT